MTGMDLVLITLIIAIVVAGIFVKPFGQVPPAPPPRSKKHTRKPSNK